MLKEPKERFHKSIRTKFCRSTISVERALTSTRRAIKRGRSWSRSIQKLRRCFRVPRMSTKHCGYWRESSGLDVTAARTKHLAHNDDAAANRRASRFPVSGGCRLAPLAAERQNRYAFAQASDVQC